MSNPSKKTFRLPYLFGGLFSYFFIGCLFVWSYFRPYLMEVYPDWTISQASFIFSIHNIFVVLGSLFCGFVLKNVSPRIKQYIQIAFIVIGLGGFRFLPVDNPALALVLSGVFFAFFAAVAVGMQTIITLDVYPRWFPDHLGLLNGCMTLCMGFCSMVLGAIASRLIPSVGPLQAMSYIGLIIGGCLFITSFFLRRPGPEDVLPPAPERTENRAGRVFTTKEALHSRKFWLLFGFNVCMRAQGLTIIDFAGTIAVAFGVSAFIGLCFSPAIAFGGIGSGTTVDKLGTNRAMMIFGSIVAAAGVILVLGHQTGATAMIIMGLIMGGFGYGGNNATNAAGIRLLFGTENYDRIFSCMQCAIIPACILQYINSLIIERMNGSFIGVFALMVMYGLIAALCGFGLGREIKKADSTVKNVDPAASVG